MLRPTTIRTKEWQLAPQLPLDSRGQPDHLHPVLSQVLANRGLTDPAAIQAFLDGTYLDASDPFLLPGMEGAVERIIQALEAQEVIVIYGDFDADGVTSTVLLTEALRGLGAERRLIRPYIPDRVDEGYGLNMEALETIKEFGAGLLITVDCGIRSLAEVAYANELGMDVIITDHHSLGHELPQATAVINPKRPESPYPDTMLAGVGIAYKLAQALYERWQEPTSFDVSRLLDLVAVGTVADLAPLHNENRFLVSEGLQVLNRLERPGLNALAQLAGLKPGAITAESIGFTLGPRINAAGRLEHAYSAARLLAANNSHSARQLAEELNALNRRRQRLTADLGEIADGLVDSADYILIACHEEFQSGIVGLVASRLSEKHYRPAIVIELGEEFSRGSCRSIPDFHITAALDEVSDLLLRHGGHAQAAGFTLRNEDLDDFVERMRTIAARELAGKELVPTLEIDAEVDLAEIDWALYETLQQLEPTGQGNPTPVFMSRGVEIANHRVVGREGSHLQLGFLTSGSSGKQRLISAIAFRQGEWAAMLPQFVDIVYTISLNEWNGRRNLQLVVQDMRPSTL